MSKTGACGRLMGESMREAVLEAFRVQTTPVRSLPAIALTGVTILVSVIGCSDSPPGLCSSCPPPPPPGLIISNPITWVALMSEVQGDVALAGGSGSDVVYVSLIPGTAPTGIRAIVQRVGDFASVTTAVINGGFDPVPVTARTGDSIAVTVSDAVDSMVLSTTVRVMAARPPVIVRTEPPPKKRDVPLNATIVIVFSEPIDSTTLNASTVRLSRGTNAVAGTVTRLAGTATDVAFNSSAPLDPNTDYELLVTQGVRDLEGEALAAAVTVDFTTGAQSAGIPVRVSVLPDTARLLPQAQSQLSVDTLRDASGTALSGRPIIWQSEDTSIARVDANGFVTGVSAGSTHVTATVDGVRGIAVILVMLALDSTDVIAYESTRDANTDIYLVDAHGFTRLTSDPAFDGEPAWSPDGRRIAFVSNRDGQRHIYVMSGDGSGVAQLTAGSGQERAPAWSPDGSKIAFSSDRDSIGNYDIYLMNADGSGVIRLTARGGGGGPAWSPDGTKIAFSRLGDIWVMNADGTGVIRWIPHNDFGYGRLTWSPDGTKYAFAKYANSCCFNSPDLTVAYTDGSGAFRVGIYPGADDYPTWSPDGSRIAFMHDESPFGGSWQILVVNLGVGFTRLTTEGGKSPAWRPR